MLAQPHIEVCAVICCAYVLVETHGARWLNFIVRFQDVVAKFVYVYVDCCEICCACVSAFDCGFGGESLFTVLVPSERLDANCCICIGICFIVHLLIFLHSVVIACCTHIWQITFCMQCCAHRLSAIVRR